MDSPPAFQPYGSAHLVVIGLIVTLPFLLAIIVGKSPQSERVVDGILTALLLANYVGYLCFIRRLAGADWKQLLPLQLCDWAMLVIIVALWTHRQGWFEVAYFWGIGGTLQAVLTPNLAFGFPDLRFFSFFVAHGTIIVGVAFLMLVHRLRPRPLSILRVFAWTEIYFLITLAADNFTGFNYGFLLHKPEAKTLLSLLSDHRTLYLFQMHLLALAFFIALYLPFAVYDIARLPLLSSRTK